MQLLVVSAKTQSSQRKILRPNGRIFSRGVEESAENDHLPMWHDSAEAHPNPEEHDHDAEEEGEVGEADVAVDLTLTFMDLGAVYRHVLDY
jgi:hypothetical protein